MRRVRAVLLSVLLLLGAGTTVLPAPAAAAPCVQTDPIDRYYCELGGQASYLGLPVGGRYTVGAGVGQDYTGGRVFWSAPTGAHAVHGGIGERYRQMGGPPGLGFPQTDELPTADGSGRYQHFERGSIFWSPTTGAHDVHGAIRARYADGGWERGLGYPTTDEAPASDGIGWYSHFQRGSIFWSPTTGAHDVHGAIRARYADGGWERGLGYPTTDEAPASDGIGWYSHFQRGSIFWSPTTGAHEVRGANRDRYASLGWERSPLGYPITDEYAVNGGWQSDFQRGFLRWVGATGAVRVALLAPYDQSGTWVTRYRFSREFAGATPPITPATVDAMATAGVDTIYLQAAADDPRYPDLISRDLLEQFVVRAHARGIQVVAWYLPRLVDVNADLRRLQAMIDFRASGQAFDAIAVDIEDLSVADVDTRNARLVDLSARLHAMAPNTTLGAIVLPPVVTDVINPAYWPRFPWRQLAPYYQVWMPMAYWSNRTAESGWRDAYRYTAENTARVRANLGEACAAVSVIGGFGTVITAAEYAEMARAARDQGAVGVSIFDWTTTPAASWPPLRDYAVRGC